MIVKHTAHQPTRRTHNTDRDDAKSRNDVWRQSGIKEAHRHSQHVVVVSHRHQPLLPD